MNMAAPHGHKHGNRIFACLLEWKDQNKNKKGFQHFFSKDVYFMHFWSILAWKPWNEHQMGKTAESLTTRFYFYNVTTEGCPRDVFTKYRCQIDTMTIFLAQRVYVNWMLHHHEISFIKWSAYEFIKDYLENGVSISFSWLVMRSNIRILCNLLWILTIQNICTD